MIISIGDWPLGKSNISLHLANLLYVMVCHSKDSEVSIGETPRKLLLSGKVLKMHLVKWDIVCKVKNLGGLGLRRLEKFQQGPS